MTCGTLEVPEDRAIRGGRRIALELIVIPATNRQRRAVPIFILAGGPGQTITDAAPVLASSWERQQHDVVLVDQRGTGDGNRLDCAVDTSKTPFNTPFSAAFAHDCGTKLSAAHDLSQYTTAAAVADLDEVRRALGYRKIALQAVSFGTYYALMYMRAHPRAVHSAFLYSVVSPENLVPLGFARSSQDAVDGLAAQCRADRACGSAFPNFRSDFDRAVARLELEPALVELESRPGASRTVKLTAEAFADSVRILLYSTKSAHQLPLLITQAAAGDYKPFVEVAAPAYVRFYSGARWGVFFSITCNEFVARIPEQAVKTASVGTFLGDVRTRSQEAACTQWPKSRVPRGFFAPFRVTVPTVLVSGDLDPATPAFWGERVRRMLPNSAHLVIPGGHGPWNPCLREVGRQLFSSGSVAGLKAKCHGPLEREPFVVRAEAIRH